MGAGIDAVSAATAGAVSGVWPPQTPTAPGNLIATATSTPSVLLTWNASSGSVAHYEIQRATNRQGPFTTLAPTIVTSFTDNSVSSGTTYIYRVRAVDAQGNYSNFSNGDIATTVIFEDDPLNPNGTKTLIRAQHLTQLRQAVNAVRILAGLPTASWTYSDPVSDPPHQRRNIYLEDVTDLRAKLDEALTILERVQPYDPNPPLARYSPISAAHFTQIRNRVK